MQKVEWQPRVISRCTDQHQHVSDPVCKYSIAITSATAANPPVITSLEHSCLGDIPATLVAVVSRVNDAAAVLQEHAQAEAEAEAAAEAHAQAQAHFVPLNRSVDYNVTAAPMMETVLLTANFTAHLAAAIDAAAAATHVLNDDAAAELMPPLRHNSTDSSGAPAGVLLILALIGTSVILSLLTLHLVENPCRTIQWRTQYDLHGTPTRGFHAVAKLLSSLLLLVFCLGLFVSFDGLDALPQRRLKQAAEADTSEARHRYQQLDREAYPVLDECVKHVTAASVKSTFFMDGEEALATPFRQGKSLVINPTGHGTVIFLGDSHARQWHPRFERLVALYGDTIPTIEWASHSACPIWPGNIPTISIDNERPSRRRRATNPEGTISNIISWECSSGVQGRLHNVVDGYGDDVSAVVFSAYYEYILGGMRWSPYDTQDNVVRWPRSHAELRLRPLPDDTQLIADAWSASIRSLVGRGIDVYVIRPHPTFLEPLVQLVDQAVCHHPPLPAPSLSTTGERRRCYQCGPSGWLQGGNCGRGSCTSNSLQTNIRHYLQPMNASEYHRVAAFIAEPLMDAAADAGATILDPASTMCLDGACPVIDPQGRSVYRDTNHYARQAVREYASFLDVIVGVSGAPSEARYCV